MKRSLLLSSLIACAIALPAGAAPLALTVATATTTPTIVAKADDKTAAKPGAKKAKKANKGKKAELGANKK